VRNPACIPTSFSGILNCSEIAERQAGPLEDCGKYEKISEMSNSDLNLWIYFLPVLHLCACLISMVGFVIPSLQHLGMVSTYIMTVDLPISLVAVALVWKHSALATAWISVVGTLWWYLLSRGAELVLRKFRDWGRAAQP